MYIKNPNKKISYSFRINPNTLEDLKLYCKATNQTIPELLNDMIEEEIKDLHLTNDYLDNKMATNSIIGLPPLEAIYNNGNYKEFGLFENENRVLYEVQRVPNNLDIWTDNKGYTTDERGADHEGLSLVLAPELITKPEYLETPELLFCCLIPVYFKISIKRQSIQAKNISFNKALKKINNSPNMDLLDEFTQSTQLVKDIILHYYDTYKNAIANPNGTFTAGDFIYTDKNQLLFDIYNKLIIELNEATIKVNINVINHYSNSTERLQNKEPQTVITKDGVITTDTILTEILEENQALQERVTELENGIKTIFDRIGEALDDPDERVKIWESIKENKE